VISGSLDVEGGKVHAGVGLLLVLEQVVRHLLRDELDGKKFLALGFRIWGWGRWCIQVPRDYVLSFR
jgi:hypothetical protein